MAAAKPPPGSLSGLLVGHGPDNGSALVSDLVAAIPPVHDAVALRLAGLDQRYTTTRRLVVDALATAGRPLTVPEIVASDPRLPQSSAYRITTALIEAGVLRRVAGADDHGRFELAEELSGHHHHLVCASCGKVEDVHPSPRLEKALGDAARVVADDLGYEISEHRLDLMGYCPACRNR